MEAPFVVELVASGLAAAAAGLVNAVAGGGTLISFPTLTFLGVPALAANVTNTVALCPGYLGGAYAQREDLASQKATLARLLPVSIAGGLSGGLLLMVTSEALFRSLVPFLILLATALLAAQKRLKDWVVAREAEAARQGRKGGPGPLGLLAVYVAAVYGGYFGAGLGIVLLAVLGAVVDDDLVRVNALKQAVSLSVNVTAALYFLVSGPVRLPLALSMAVFALLGGHVGGKLARRLEADTLRGIVIASGLVVSGYYFLR